MAISNVWARGNSRAVIVAQIACLAVGLIWPTPAMATCIIGIIEPHKIILAADGLAQDTNHGKMTHRPQCKIFRTPNCIYATSGRVSANYKGFAFDARTLARKACDYSGSASEKADAFTALAKNPIAKLTAHDPSFQQQHILTRIDVVDALFVAVQNSHLQLSTRAFRVTPDGKIAACKKQFDATADLPPTYVTAACKDEMSQFLRPFQNKPEDASLARQYIQFEIVQHAEDIGPPISELEIRVDRNTHQLDSHWIKGGACN